MTGASEATMPGDVVRVFGALPVRRGRVVAVRDWGADSVQGCNRASNEDVWGHRHARTFVVADGMGGRPGGALAAAAAVAATLDTLERQTTSPDWSAVMMAANDAVRSSARRAGHDRVGAALAGVHLGADRVTVFHLGDVRVYRLRGSTVEALTVDHTVREQLARAHLDHRRLGIRTRELEALTGFLGDDDSAGGFGVRTLAVVDGDRLVICSDGVHRRIDTSAWVQASLATDAESAERLVRTARAAGSTDDATAVVLTFTVTDARRSTER